MNWTEEQVREAENRFKGGASRNTNEKTSAPVSSKAGAKHSHGMNGWEKSYSLELEARKQAGEIIWWEFEPLRFRLADGAWFKPDFCWMSKDGVVSVSEIKGHWRTASRLRIKVAADRHPFLFVALRKRKAKEGGGWDREEFRAMLDRVKGG